MQKVNSFYFFQPGSIIFERGCLEKGLKEASALGLRALVVCGRHFASRTGLLEKVKKILESAGLVCTLYDRVKPEPDVENVEQGADICRRAGCDLVVAVGGGSALDAGKAIAVLATNPGRLADYFGQENFPTCPLPVVAIPTTCGTGSEVTRYAVIVDRQAETKKTISSLQIIPKIAILDSDLLKTLPARLVAATAMDAFSHAVESFLARRANYLSRGFSRMALKALSKGLPGAVRDKDPDSFKEQVFFGSLVAGLAINHTGTIMVHGMGYAFTIRYGVHHGTANAVVLAPVLEYLKTKGQEKEISELETFWGGPAGLKKLLQEMKLPSKLSEFGVEEKDIGELVRLAVIGCQRAVKNMFVAPEKKDYEQILRSIL